MGRWSQVKSWALLINSLVVKHLWSHLCVETFHKTIIKWSLYFLGGTGLTLSFSLLFSVSVSSPFNWPSLFLFHTLSWRKHSCLFRLENVKVSGVECMRSGAEFLVQVCHASLEHLEWQQKETLKHKITTGNVTRKLVEPIHTEVKIWRKEDKETRKSRSSVYRILF